MHIRYPGTVPLWGV